MKANEDVTSVNALTFGMAQGIEMLLVAYRYSQEAHRDHWEFAVEIKSLQDTGVNNAELRWLVCKGLVRHAEEKKKEAKAKPRRAFHQFGDMAFLNRSCFILTKKGFESYQRLLPENANSASTE